MQQFYGHHRIKEVKTTNVITINKMQHKYTRETAKKHTLKKSIGQYVKDRF